jgi:hypothetical protein
MYTVQTPKNSRFIFLHCHSMLILIGKAFHCKQLDFALLYCGVYLTSINHWKNPIHESRQQKIDRIMVRIAILYSISACYIRAKDILIPYLTSVGVGILCYQKAKNHPNKDRSMKWHLMMHYIGHVSNWVLYSFLKKKT